MFNQPVVGIDRKIIGFKQCRKIDFLFIDGDHSYKGVTTDFRLYSPLVKDYGNIAFHDIIDGHTEKSYDFLKMGEENGMESLAFWKGLNWIGDYFSANGMDDTLISFNIVDNAMSLVKEKEMIKYLYHHQEAMWNKIFTSYFGENEMENKIKENIINGIIKL